MCSCAICNKPLTDPESKRRGIGPDCWSKMQYTISQNEENDNTIYLLYKEGDDIILERGEDGKIMNVSRTIVKHSPTGLEWGYGGSGPADLALNILSMFVPANEAMQYYQDFKWEFVAKVPREGGTIKYDDIKRWISAKKVTLFTHFEEEE